MTWVDLGDPVPWPEARPHRPVRWPDGVVRSLAADTLWPQKSFADIATRRRTRRSFAALDEARLGALLALTRSASRCPPALSPPPGPSTRCT